MIPEIELDNIDSASMLALKQRAIECLNIACALLRKNKGLNIHLLSCKCGTHPTGKTLVSILYSADDNEVRLHVLDKVFKDENLKADASVGIKPGMSLKTKILLRVARLLYTHRKDY